MNISLSLNSLLQFSLPITLQRKKFVHFIYKYIVDFSRIALGPMIISIFILWSSASLCESTQGDSFEIGSIPMSEDISAVIRLMCFDNDSVIIVSNTLGSDAVMVANDSCGSNDVTDYKFIFAK